MSDIPTLRQVDLGFKVASVEIPLTTFVKRGEGSNKGPSSPAFVPPEVGDSLELLPRRDLALRELLSHANSGHARLFLPLPRRELKGGPITIDLTGGHEMIFDLEVVDTQVLRDKTHGTIEPPIPLPLWTSFKGIYLNSRGAVIADIDKFVDINLSLWSDSVPRIPTSLDEVLDLLFADAGKSDDEAEEVEQEDERDEEARSDDAQGEQEASGEDEGTGVDWSKLRVEARGVTSRAARPLELGRAGQLVLAKGTRLDVDYSKVDLWVRGRGVVEAAGFEGKGFVLRGISGEGEFSWRLLGEGEDKRMELRVEGAEAELAQGHLTLPDGSQLRLDRSRLRGVSLTLTTSQEGMTFSVEVEKASVDLAGGKVFLTVAGQRTEVNLSPLHAEGRIAVSNEGIELDVELSEVALEVPATTVDLGVVTLDVSALSLCGAGRFSGRSSEGYRFTGEVEARGDIADSSFNLEQLSARLAQGSVIALRVTDLATDPEGLNALSGSGEATLRLKSGAIPIGPESKVHFSRGAEGTLKIESVKLPSRKGAWPELKGSVRVRAISEPISIRTFASLPAGEAHLGALVALDEAGLLRLSDLAMSLRSAAE